MSNSEARTTTPGTTAWINTMTSELRLRGVHGDAIGDAVALVNSHCAESHESPQEAFGDPRAYATSLDFPARQVRTRSGAIWIAAIAPSLSGILGLPLAVSSVEALRSHTSMPVQWSELVALVVLAALGAATIALTPVILRHRTAFVACMTAGVLAMTLIAFTLHAIAFTAPAAAGACVSILLLALSVIGSRHTRLQADPVRHPVTGQPHRASAGPGPLADWTFVILAIAGVALSLLAR